MFTLDFSMRTVINYKNTAKENKQHLYATNEDRRAISNVSEILPMLNNAF
tara:strand:- start:1 stop:150 length:150 start_codon:yes stop_codon:yes gene_type:complete